MAALMILDQVDETTDSLIESISEVQNTIYELHTTVGDLLNSMSEMLKSMTEMKSTLYEPPAEVQNLPDSPEKQSIVAVDNSIEVKKVQIEMPVFEGLNVYQWISKAERYFEIGNFNETEKLRLVYSSVEGEALNWYNFWKLRKPFVNWNDLKTRVLDRFGENLKSGCAIDRILRLKQVGSVIVYLSEFEELASQLSDSDGTDELLEAVFLCGLKEEIRNTVRLFRVSRKAMGLNDVITMALELENSPFCRLKNQLEDYSSSSPTNEDYDDDITK